MSNSRLANEFLELLRSLSPNSNLSDKKLKLHRYLNNPSLSTNGMKVELDIFDLYLYGLVYTDRDQVFNDLIHLYIQNNPKSGSASSSSSESKTSSTDQRTQRFLKIKSEIDLFSKLVPSDIKKLLAMIKAHRDFEALKKETDEYKSYSTGITTKQNLIAPLAGALTINIVNPDDIVERCVKEEKCLTAFQTQFNTGKLLPGKTPVGQTNKASPKESLAKPRLPSFLKWLADLTVGILFIGWIRNYIKYGVIFFNSGPSMGANYVKKADALLASIQAQKTSTDATLQMLKDINEYDAILAELPKTMNDFLVWMNPKLETKLQTDAAVTFNMLEESQFNEAEAKFKRFVELHDQLRFTKYHWAYNLCSRLFLRDNEPFKADLGSLPDSVRDLFPYEIGHIRDNDIKELGIDIGLLQRFKELRVQIVSRLPDPVVGNKPAAASPASLGRSHSTLYPAPPSNTPAKGVSGDSAHRKTFST